MFANIADAGVPFGDKYASFGVSTTPSFLFWHLYSGLDSTGNNITETINGITYTYRDHMIDTDSNGTPDNYKPELIDFTVSITGDDGTIAAQNLSRLKQVIGLYESSPGLITGAIGEPNTWDVSQITSMYALFKNKETFDADISDWDVSNVTDMGEMFRIAKKFNQDISKWNTSKVTSMYGMFYDARAFNQDLIPSVQTRDGVEYVAWDTSNVDNMNGMFQEAHEFNGDISSLDTRNVTSTVSMFRGARKFNRTIGEKTINALNDSNGNELKALYTAWDTQNVSDMSHMFYNAQEFNNGSVKLDPDTGEYVASSNPGPELYFNTSNVMEMEKSKQTRMLQ